MGTALWDVVAGSLALSAAELRCKHVPGFITELPHVLGPPLSRLCPAFFTESKSERHKEEFG